MTEPKAIADRYGIRPGGEIDGTPAGELTGIVASGKSNEPEDREFRLRLFDQATERQRRRKSVKARQPGDRAWRREDLYLG